MANKFSKDGMSDMEFVSENAFHIEQSQAYESIKQYGIDSVEFVRIKDHELLFIEAKASFPNPNNPDATNLARFDEEIGEIREKFIDSLELYSYILSGIAHEDLPDDFTPDKQMPLVFMLVIKDHKIEWCSPVQRALTGVIPKHIKKICKPEVRVINHEEAITQQLAIS